MQDTLVRGAAHLSAATGTYDLEPDADGQDEAAALEGIRAWNRRRLQRRRLWREVTPLHRQSQVYAKAAASLRKTAGASTADERRRVSPEVWDARGDLVDGSYFPGARFRNDPQAVANQLLRPNRSQPPQARTRGRSREHRPAATRRSSSSSRTSSADPGDDSPGEPDSPSGRLCAAPWCHNPVYGGSRQKYCRTAWCDRQRQNERQRQFRTVDLVVLERRGALEKARIGHYLEFAEARRSEDPYGLESGHSLSLRFPAGEDPGEHEARCAHADHRECRCNGHHIGDGNGGCIKCGLWRSEAVVSCS